MSKTSFTRPNRDSVTTIRDDGSRLFLHPADAHGRFTTWRRWSGWLLIAVYLALPWIPIGGHPAVFLDIAERRFHLFGLTLAFQDAWLLFFGISGLGFSLFFITALLGRVWCGWACPHTVFLEHVYRRIERWLEGDAVVRRRLDAAPWGAIKLLRRGLKQLIFITVSAGIAHLFLAYFVSIPELWSMMRTAPGDHWGAFVFVLVFTGALYFNFAWFREQLCLIICPYGRLQSVLVDDDSLGIGYDEQRGEPRGKAGTPDAGACVDCNRCVQVCPTGIDIRHGLQIECIGCAACIDACDAVMDKLSRPRGLVRYDSQTGLAGGVTRWLRARTIVYAVLMLVGASVATWAATTIKPATLAVTRMVGAPYYMADDGLRNQFLVRLINKKDVPARFIVTIETDGQPVQQTGINQVVELAPLAEQVQPLILQMSRADYQGPFAFRVHVTDETGTYTLEREAKFTGPHPSLLGLKSEASP